jgi:thiol:disulfide interchange protein DsbD
MRAVLTIFMMLISTISMAQSFDGVNRSLSDSSNSAEFLPVEEAYRLDVEVRENSEINLHWEIAESYYLYQHRFDFKLAESSEQIALDVKLSEGLDKTDEFFGEVVVYYHDANVTLRPDKAIDQGILTVTFQGCADAGLCYPPHKQYFQIDFSGASAIPIEKPVVAKTVAEPAITVEEAGGNSLAYMLLLAFLGGAILNLMPCVFPILSLKVLSFARSSDHDRHLHSWIYTLGVIASFVFVAAVLIALQQAGQAIGWGFQLQSPGFVIALAYLFVAMGLSLSGLIEFGGSMMNVGSGYANRSGMGGSFFTGVLAVVVASPCTAPFMGTALGFAVSQPPAIALLVFASLGAGMAAPLLIFSYSGAARALMPKPGAWMETLKELLAFPLYATAIWLLWVAGRQTGVNTMAAALIGALLLALALWLWDQKVWRRGLALACLAASFSLGFQLDLDGPRAATAAVSGDKVTWSDHGVAELRRDGKPVFVDVTADWCITCKANEAAVLLTDELNQAFVDHGVVYMIADWTNYDPQIAGLLKKYGRTGIPLYLMYPADLSSDPLILPQILTKGMVLEAINAVSVKKQDDAIVFEEISGF